ncbi:MAG: hypothetical protein HUU46_05770 [Candidatus Hydrogenedentes bacterium]|nr:hypothetical protein [Candidatus Hydrogenedentota bacterium]
MSRREFLAAGGSLALTAGLAYAASGPERHGGDADLLAKLCTPNKHPELVLAPSYEAGSYDALAIDCPFVFAADGLYYMVHIGFDGIGYRTGLAHSNDLIHWKKKGLILDRGEAGSVTEYNIALTWIVRDNDLFGTGALKRVQGRYLGTYHAYPKPGYETGPAVIGLCWSDDLREWTIEPPCLSASDTSAGPWEQGGLYKSCLVEESGTYYMFYNAKTKTEPWIEQTGVAISADLKTWRRFERNPILPVGPRGAFDDVFCSDPAVVRVGETWAMFFYTLGSDGRARDSVAFSGDLFAWRKSNEILIDVGPPGAVDSRYAHKPSVIVKDGTLYHFYCAVSPMPERTIGDHKQTERRGIGVATS